jgi:AH receptor-interacting protein
MISFCILQVRFHFSTKIINKGQDGKVEEGEVIDDSHNYDQPVEILIGKQFKLEVWETIIQSMAINEVAEYQVDKNVKEKHINLLFQINY